MLTGVINYVMILVQFRYNDKQLLAEELASQNITTTPTPPFWG